MVSDMVNFMNKNTISKAIVIGHSLGGIVFSRLATLYPDLVEKLVLLDIHPSKRVPESSPVFLTVELLKQIIETLKDEDVETAKTRAIELMKEKIKVRKRLFNQINLLIQRC